MAPEQLEGQKADERTDIFAFGLVAYEMVTGAKAFEGETQASLIGAVLKDEPVPASTRQPLIKSGHLLYVAAGTLFGVAFDRLGLTAPGTPVPLVEDVLSTQTITGAAQFALSAQGISRTSPGVIKCTSARFPTSRVIGG